VLLPECIKHKKMYILIYKSHWIQYNFYINPVFSWKWHKLCSMTETPTGRVSSYCIPEFKYQYWSVS